MSRRSVRWKKVIAQAGGDVNKVIPQKAVGAGVWLTDSDDLPMKPKRGQGKGTTCTLPMSSAKEAIIRRLK